MRHEYSFQILTTFSPKFTATRKDTDYSTEIYIFKTVVTLLRRSRIGGDGDHVSRIDVMGLLGRRGLTSAPTLSRIVLLSGTSFFGAACDSKFKLEITCTVWRRILFSLTNGKIISCLFISLASSVVVLGIAA